MVAMEGLCLAKDLEIRVVILEGDAKTVIECFQNSSMDLSHNGLILFDAFRVA